MTNLISQTFEKKNKKLVTFVTGGDPNLEISNQIIKILISNKIDILEIGMPFSDPMADGPTIQLSSNRALKNNVNLNDIFELASNAKTINKNIPIILMGYYNVVLHYGIQNFVKKCVSHGVDGLIIVDLQPEEDEDLSLELQNNKIDLIRLITPTTDEKRLRHILKNASGFLYYVTVMGTTGQKSVNIKDLNNSIKFIKKFTDLPIVPGFGIKNEVDVNNVCKIADGAVVGSSLVKIIEENQNNVLEMYEKLNEFTKKLKNGTNI